MDLSGPEDSGLSHCYDQKEPRSWFEDMTGLFRPRCVPSGLEIDSPGEVRPDGTSQTEQAGVGAGSNTKRRTLAQPQLGQVVKWISRQLVRPLDRSRGSSVPTAWEALAQIPLGGPAFHNEASHSEGW